MNSAEFLESPRLKCGRVFEAWRAPLKYQYYAGTLSVKEQEAASMRHLMPRTAISTDLRNVPVRSHGLSPLLSFSFLAHFLFLSLFFASARSWTVISLRLGCSKAPVCIRMIADSILDRQIRRPISIQKSLPPDFAAWPS